MEPMTIDLSLYMKSLSENAIELLFYYEDDYYFAAETKFIPFIKKTEKFFALKPVKNENIEFLRYRLQKESFKFTKFV